MSTHDHIQYEATASVGSDKLDLTDPALKEAYLIVSLSPPPWFVTPHVLCIFTFPI
jgi:hypothetical protein